MITPQGPHKVIIASDASGTWGCGAWYDMLWFQLEWDNEICQKHITVKELIVILTAAFVWSPLLHGKRVTSVTILLW